MLYRNPLESTRPAQRTVDGNTCPTVLSLSIQLNVIPNEVPSKVELQGHGSRSSLAAHTERQSWIRGPGECRR